MTRDIDVTWQNTLIAYLYTHTHTHTHTERERERERERGTTIFQWHVTRQITLITLIAYAYTHARTHTHTHTHTHRYNYLPMTRDMAEHIKCDHDDSCLKALFFPIFFQRALY